MAFIIPFLQHTIRNMLRKQNQQRQLNQSRPRNRHKNKGSVHMEYNDQPHAIHINDYFPQIQQKNDSATTAKIESKEIYGLIPKSQSRSLNSSQKSASTHLETQISRLNSKLSNKNKQLIQMKSPQKIKDIEVMELYRVIHYYDGKIKHMEEQIKKYEQSLKKIGLQCDEKSLHKAEVSEMIGLFESMRQENSELMGKIEQKDYVMGGLEKRVHKQQVRINFLRSKKIFQQSVQSSEERVLISSQKSQIFRPSHPSSSLDLRAKQQNYGNLHSKINRIQTQLNYLKKQNQTLESQLQVRSYKIYQLQAKLIQSSLNGFQGTNETQKIQSYSNRLKGVQRKISDGSEGKIIIKKSISSTEKMFCRMPLLKNDTRNTTILVNQTAPKQVNQSTINKQSKVQEPPTTTINYIKPIYPIKPVLDPFNQFICQRKKNIDMNIFAKLRYQLITEEVNFMELIKMLIDEELQSEVLEESPYNLKSVEAEDLVEWVQETIQLCNQKLFDAKKVLSSIIPQFHNFTLRQENNLKIQMANEYNNREAQINNWFDKHSLCDYQQLQTCLHEWGLTTAHTTVLCKSFYEETGLVAQFQGNTLKNIIMNWVQL